MRAPEPEILPFLRAALADFELSDQAYALLAQHWQLLCQWNAVTNLTAVTAPQQAAWLHYRDSLEGLAYLQAGPVVDFGSGAGFPGIPLAVARPQWQFTLVEPRRKRASFLHQAVACLRLDNVRIYEARLEDPPDRRYAHAVTRATFAQPIADVQLAAWLKEGATLIAYRSVSGGTGTDKRHCYEVLGQQRCLHIQNAPRHPGDGMNAIFPNGSA